MQSKMSSRKFMVYLIGVAFSVTAIVITKTVPAEVVNFMSVLSAVYIGGNAASKFIKKE